MEIGALLAQVHWRLLILAVRFQELLEVPVLYTNVMRELHAIT